ncbi:MAG: glycosyltransferase [Actinomycetota bacterium]
MGKPIGSRQKVIHLLPDLAIGGGQTIVFQHLASADKNRFDLSVVYLSPPDQMLQAYQRTGAEVMMLPFGPGGALGAAWRLARLMRRRGVDLLHVHSDPDRKIGQLAALVARVPVVGHLHSIWMHLGPMVPVGAGPRRRLRAEVFGAARDLIERTVVKHYVSGSRDVRELFNPLVRAPITVLDQEIRLQIFDEAAGGLNRSELRAELGLPPSGPILVNVSRLVEGKGQRYLVQAVQILVEQGLDISLVLIGDGEQRAMIESDVAAAGLGERVRLVGARRDVPRLLALADIFVFGSENEGFGLAVLEAMAAAKPVVAFQIPALEEFTVPGETALLVPQGDVAGFAAAISRLLSEPDTATAMGRAGRATVAERFPAGGVARTFEVVYDEVLQACRARRHLGRERSARGRRLKPIIRSLWRRVLIARGTDVTAAAAQRSCLVLAPHPDDETLGCGASIIAKRRAGTPVRVVVATDGRHSHRSAVLSEEDLAELRAREVTEACRRLGVERNDLIFLGYEDGTLGRRIESVAEDLAKIIGDFQPDEVLVTSELDWHTDHQALSRALRMSLKDNPNPPRVSAYSVWYWTDGPWHNRPGQGRLSRVASLLVDPLVAAARMRLDLVSTTGLVNQKRRALEAHHSQLANLTGEDNWAVLDGTMIEGFLGPYELFIPWAHR